MRLLPPILCLLATLLGLTVGAEAQSVRLALVVENPAAMPAGDLLTVALSKEPQITLLERAQINQVLREQALSAADGRDYLKLGEILGADGLLIIDLTERDGKKSLSSRLVAVKPGVALAAADYPFPLPEPERWSQLAVKQLELLFPKLGVLTRDAVPISLLHLRSAVQSAETGALEHELNLLLLSRLMHEKEIFVLERQKLEELAGEKELKGLTNSTFWNGSYVLDGTIDPDGYNRDTLTISARLAPPGKPAVNLEIRGKRSQPVIIINELVSKILIALRKEGGSQDWKPADEAAQYFEEAKWAFKWRMPDDAHAGVESAWALGKRDMDCATLRVRCQLEKVSFPPFGELVQGRVLELILDNKQAGAGLSADDVPKAFGLERNPLGLVFEPDEHNHKIVRFAYAKQAPNVANLDHLRRALDIYVEFSRTLPPDEPSINSPWYKLGVETLDAASQSLQHFHFFPELQPAVNDELSGLRSLARSAAAWISKSPSARAAYWTWPASIYAKSMESDFKQPDNIFQCELDWGRFWQDTPENCVELYRELMSAAAFPYVRKSVWLRLPATPRLTAWNAEEGRRTPELWRHFIGELVDSTNLSMRLEARLLELVDAKDENESGAAFDSLFNTIFANYEAIMTDHLDLDNFVATANDLVSWRVVTFRPLNGMSTFQMPIPINESLKQRLDSKYRPRLEALSRISAAGGQLAAFERQKEYLRKLTPYNPSDFAETFRFSEYTKAQAEELLPLMAAYRTNFERDSHATEASNVANSPAAVAGGVLWRAESGLRLLANPPNAPLNRAMAARPAQTNVTSMMPATGPKTPVEALLARRFFRIPRDPAEDVLELRVFAHRWRENKLWLDLRYDEPSQGYAPRSARSAAMGVWNPTSESWEIIPYPDPGQLMGMVKFGTNNVAENGLYFEIFNHHLYASGSSGIKKYDFDSQQWVELPLPGEAFTRLFAINDHLYAANSASINEIMDDGRSTRLLASVRRRPAATPLDSLGTLGSTTLFPGPRGSVRAQVEDGIYSWDGHDWSESFRRPFRAPPEVFEHGAFLRSAFYNLPSGFRFLLQLEDLWFLPDNQANPELLLHREWIDEYPQGIRSTNQAPQSAVASAWAMPSLLSAVETAVAPAGSNLFVLLEHGGVTNVAGHRTVPEKDGRHADLYFFGPDSRQPIVIPLKFEPASGPAPAADHSHKDLVHDGRVWMLIAGNLLLIGQESLPGVWAIPRVDIDDAIDRQKQAQISARISARNALLAKYDQNKNGEFEPEEIKLAILDPDFVEYELNAIHTNRGKWLDPRELKSFDLDHDGILEPTEQDALELAQRCLAARLIAEFDSDGDGKLDLSEFLALRFEVGTSSVSAQWLAKTYGGMNRKLGCQEIESFLMERTLADLRTSLSEANPLKSNGNLPRSAPRAIFKATLEAYWKETTARTATHPPGESLRSSAGGQSVPH